jgi:hypothetical protein
MTVLSPVNPALNFLNGSYLDLWNTHPVSGSLLAPYWESAPRSAGFHETIIRDGRFARNVLETALLVLQDCRRFRNSLAESGHPLPQPLPACAAGWTLSNFHEVSDPQVGGMAHFEQAENPKRLILDLRDPKSATLEVSLNKGNAEVTQKITVCRDRFTVTTEYYFIRTRMKDPAQAADLAAALATLVYDCGQYDVDRELGPLKIRNGDNGREWTLRRVKGRFTFSGHPPISSNDLLLVSALSVFEVSDSYYREPIMTSSVSSLKSAGPYTVSLLLYRPPGRPQRRMPLKARLQKILWQTIEKKIEGS